MSMEPGRFFYELSIYRVFYFSFNCYSDSLIHPVAGYQPDPGFAQISFNHCYLFCQVKHLKLFSSILISSEPHPCGGCGCSLDSLKEKWHERTRASSDAVRLPVSWLSDQFHSFLLTL